MSREKAEDLRNEFEATGYTSWINADLYPDGRIYTQEYTEWLEKQVLSHRSQLEGAGMPSEKTDDELRTIANLWAANQDANNIGIRTAFAIGYKIAESTKRSECEKALLAQKEKFEGERAAILDEIYARRDHLKKVEMEYWNKIYDPNEPPIAKPVNREFHARMEESRKELEGIIQNVFKAPRWKPE